LNLGQSVIINGACVDISACYADDWEWRLEVIIATYNTSRFRVAFLVTPAGACIRASTYTTGAICGAKHGFVLYALP